MERLKTMKESLMSCVQSQMGNLHNVDAKELGEAVDMIKDLEEAIYYATITKAMEDKDKAGDHYKNTMFYPVMYYDSPMRKRYEEPIMYYDEWHMRDGYVHDPYLEEMMRDKRRGKMYYDGSGSTSHHVAEGSSPSGISGPRNYPMEIRDVREGRSGIRRRFYMEAKENKHGTPAKMKELEEYLKELSEDITEMIEDASPEEKTVLQQKLVTLANKVKNV